MTKQDKEILNAIAQAIYDKKGCNILVLDVRGISTMTNYFVIAEGSVNRHVKSLSTHIKEQLSLMKLEPYQIEGSSSESEWIVMDYGDIVIHLFIPEMRERYAIEELWKSSEIVDVDIVVLKELSYPSKE